MRDASSPERPHVIVYYDGTFVHLRNGAHMRIPALLSYLQGEGYDVTVFSFSNHPTEPWTEEAQALFHKNFPTVKLVLDERTSALRRLTTLKNMLTSFFPARSDKILAMKRANASPNYEKLVADKPDAVWIVNYADGLTQLNGLPHGPIVVETHDLKFVNVAKKANASPFNIRSLLRMRSELGVLSEVQGVVAVAPTETGFFRSILARPRTFYIPRYGLARTIRRLPKPADGYHYDLLFVGSEMFLNALGLMAFFTANAAWLPELRIAVAGKVCNDTQVRAFAEGKPNIDLLGFVDDLAEVYAASKVAISPVDGTGVKIKAIDALSYGLPVFGSMHTLEGLAPGYETCAFPLTRTHMEPFLKDDARLEAARKAAVVYWEGLVSNGDLGGFGEFMAAQAHADAPAVV